MKFNFCENIKKILCKFSCNKCNSECLNDSHDTIINNNLEAEKIHKELEEIRHEIKNTLHLLYSQTSSEKVEDEYKLDNTVALINHKITPEYLKLLICKKNIYHNNNNESKKSKQIHKKTISRSKQNGKGISHRKTHNTKR